MSTQNNPAPTINIKNVRKYSDQDFKRIENIQELLFIRSIKSIQQFILNHFQMKVSSLLISNLRKN